MINFYAAPTHTTQSPYTTHIPASAVCLHCGKIKMFNAAHAIYHGAPVCCNAPMFSFVPRHDDRKPPWPAQPAFDE